MRSKFDRSTWPQRLRWLADDRGAIGFARVDASNMLRCDGKTAYTALEAERAAGTIVLVGSGRTGRYFTPEHARAAEAVEWAAA